MLDLFFFAGSSRVSWRSMNYLTCLNLSLQYVCRLLFTVFFLSPRLDQVKFYFWEPLWFCLPSSDELTDSFCQLFLSVLRKYSQNCDILFLTYSTTPSVFGYNCSLSVSLIFLSYLSSLNPEFSFVFSFILMSFNPPFQVMPDVSASDLTRVSR